MDDPREELKKMEPSELILKSLMSERTPEQVDLFLVSTAEGNSIRITSTGKIILTGLETDEAAEKFWEALQNLLDRDEWLRALRFEVEELSKARLRFVKLTKQSL